MDMILKFLTGVDSSVVLLPLDDVEKNHNSEAMDMNLIVNAIVMSL